MHVSLSLSPYLSLFLSYDLLRVSLILTVVYVYLSLSPYLSLSLTWFISCFSHMIFYTFCLYLPRCSSSSCSTSSSSSRSSATQYHRTTQYSTAPQLAVSSNFNVLTRAAFDTKGLASYPLQFRGVTILPFFVNLWLLS